MEIYHSNAMMIAMEMDSIAVSVVHFVVVAAVRLHVLPFVVSFPKEDLLKLMMEFSVIEFHTLIGEKIG